MIHADHEGEPARHRRAAPRTAAYVARWSWRASPRLTVLSAVLQLAAGVLTTFGLLATADVFTRLLQQGPTPERIVAAVPAILVVVAALSGRALLDAAVAATQGALAPRVEQRAQDALHAAVIAVDLAAFDDADFAELIERGANHGPSRVRAAVNDTGDLIGRSCRRWRPWSPRGCCTRCSPPRCCSRRSRRAGPRRGRPG